MRQAVEELLRAYAPVTMARIVAEDTELGGRRMAAGDWVLLPFPAANRDPEVFEDADRVVLDRAVNRHAAFGLGIHRCLGSNLARMELTVALEEWMARFPDFELADPDAVTWSAGQVRGPRRLPIRLSPAPDAQPTQPGRPVAVVGADAPRARGRSGSRSVQLADAPARRGFWRGWVSWVRRSAPEAEGRGQTPSP